MNNSIILPNFLNPYKFDGLIRIGKANDGGYVVRSQDIADTKNLISQNLLIDIPITYFLILSTSIYLIIFKKDKSDTELNLYVFLSALNLLLILVLYISAWRGMELESPIRYIYSFMVFYFLIFSKSLEKL